MNKSHYNTQQTTLQCLLHNCSNYGRKYNNLTLTIIINFVYVKTLPVLLCALPHL